MRLQLIHFTKYDHCWADGENKGQWKLLPKQSTIVIGYASG
ncbi:hypothetical protein [Microscilla marina]|uniref:Uncharacterized protein n=1 Tax=Microscilla marina ATCC 23134 TaxID=313606 RepID=A1ZQG7_MICM2|nr:hypothetical protein [Microscilla marina]EAY27339.1 hypothetical protein M23134_08291 [Microscilla marina ATCC 23134]